jgi:hypothetical protein
MFTVRWISKVRAICCSKNFDEDFVKMAGIKNQFSKHLLPRVTGSECVQIAD